MDKLIKFSAAELVKKSASQITYFMMKKLQREVTERQFRGEKYADEIALREEASQEKRGIIQKDDFIIFFCIDIVKNKNIFIEVKMVEDEHYEKWYLESSIVQSCLYATLLDEVKYLDTPKFRKKEGFKQEVIEVPSKKVFQLWFGNEVYEVKPNRKVMVHYMQKAQAIVDSLSKKSFDICREFDAKYKHKEFQILTPKYKHIHTLQPSI